MDSCQESEPLKIMLVEDSEHEYLAFKRAFQKSGTPCDIIHLKRAEEALDLLRSAPPPFDLLLSDYRLPGMSGLDFFREYKTLKMQQPFVIMTGCGSEQLAVEVLKAGVVDYLIKDQGLYYLELLPVMLTEIVRKHSDRMARKKVEEALFNSSQMLQLVLNTIPQRVFWKDTRLAFVGCNKPFANDFGFAEPEQLLGKTDYDITTADMAEAYQRDDMDVISSGQPKLEYEELLQKADGTAGVLRTSKLPLRSMDGSVIGVLGVYEDITSRRSMEDELLKAQKLESVALLAGGIAHDYNNVLTSILGNLSLAKLLVAKDDKLYQLLESAEQASFRAKRLTKRLITFSCGGAPVRKLIAPAKVVRDAAELVISGSKSLCEYHLPEGLWAVDADADQLGQAVGNMVLNAVQAMPDGGMLSIRFENVLLKENSALPLAGGRYVRIGIEDNGCGIAEEDQDKIFDPYFTTRESGKGLGLTMAYSIIKKHAGHITVSSRPGSGAAFSIYLPASDSQLFEEPAPETEAVKGSGRILVMDDEEIVRMVLGDILEHLGYQVGFAVNGEEAIKLYDSAVASGTPFDAVIMDLTIPIGMGGKEAVARLREKYPDARVIVSSGYSNDPVMSNFREYGFSGMVLKPYEVAELAGTLHDVLETKPHA